MAWFLCGYIKKRKIGKPIVIVK